MKKKNKKPVKRAPRSKAASKRIVVTIGDEHLPKIKSIAARLRSQGMKVDSVLEATGLITGASAKPSALKRVAGVKSVEEETRFQLPPPDSEVQ